MGVSSLVTGKIENSFVEDRLGRRFRKLRISLLDACNFNCNYCMPEKKIFSSLKGHLKSDDIFDIVRNLRSFGLEEVRFTGGEPTLRKDLPQIIDSVSTLGLKKIGLTTNAFHLGKLLPELTKTGLNSINISLDSLDPKNFFKITKSASFDLVLKNIFKAKELGFALKINCVVMKGINSHEIKDFIDFAASHDLEVRFLEVMNIGVVKANFSKWFFSAKEMIASVKEHYTFKRRLAALDSTARLYDVTPLNDLKGSEQAIKIGFIASESMPFCGNCSRLRLTPEGKIRSCLFKEDGEDIKGKPVEQYFDILQKVVNKKPTERIESIDQPMHIIGG